MSSRALISALVVCLTAADDIVIDWPKLTDFSTDFSINLQGLESMGMTGGMSGGGDGTIQVDLFGERIKVVGTDNYHIDGKGKGKGKVVNGHEFYQFTINVPESFVALRFDEHADITGMDGHQPNVDLNACAKVDFPKGLLDPSFTSRMVPQMEPMIQQNVNAVPHDDTTIDGVTVAMFNPGKAKGKGKPSPPYVGLLHDGTPVGVGVVPPQGGEWNPLLKFTNWKKGAGEFPEIPCRSVSLAELVAHPKAAKTFQVLDKVLASMKKTPTLGLPLAFLPEQPSLIFQHAAEAEAASGLIPTCLAAETATSLSMPTLAVIAGAFGGAIVFAVFFSMMVKRSSGRVALLSDVA